MRKSKSLCGHFCRIFVYILPPNRPVVLPYFIENVRFFKIKLKSVRILGIFFAFLLKFFI